VGGGLWLARLESFRIFRYYPLLGVSFVFFVVLTRVKPRPALNDPTIVC
jgi:hypothetical protein